MARHTTPPGSTLPPSVLRYLLPRPAHALWCMVFVGVVGLGPRLLNQDGDLGRHLTIGEHILTSLRIPTSDLFSFTLPGASLTPHEWLSQVIFALAHRLAGLDGVVWLCAAILATTTALVYQLGRQSGLAVALAASVLAAAAASVHWLARPHLFSMLMVAVWMIQLEHLRYGRLWPQWALPVSMLIWANLHGAFIAGFVLFGMYAVGQWLDSRPFPNRPWLVAGGLMLVASVVNPAGLGLWETSLGFISNRYLVGHTAEYFPPNFHSPSFWPFAVMIGVSLLGLGLWRPRLSKAAVIATSGWALMGLYSARNIPLYAIVAAPVIAGILAQGLADRPRWAALELRLTAVEQTLRGALWPVAAGVVVGVMLLTGVRLDFDQRGNRFLPEVFPVNAVDRLESQPPAGNGFNHFPWGGYLLYRLWPERRVFIDGQTDFYGEALTREYETVITLSPGWQAVLNRYEVRWALLPPEAPLSHALQIDLGWRVIYTDSTAVILTGP